MVGATSGVAMSAVIERQQPHQVPTITKNSPFFGMGLREASTKQLDLAGGPQTAAEVWEALKAVGFLSNHNDPAHAVFSALSRRSKTHNDILLVGKGKWDLKARYTEEALKRIEAERGAMAGRDHSAHVERTKEGMRIARDRGARLGARIKFTKEKGLEVRRRLDAGQTITDACAAVGITTATFHYYKRRGLLTWKEGDYWPPSSVEDGSTADDKSSGRPTLRVVQS